MEYLKDLSDAQLRDVSAALEAKVKDAKKKASQALSKNSDLLKAYVKTISAVPAPMTPATATDEEVADAAAAEVVRVRQERRLAFEKSLVEFPDAYILYHMAEYLRTLSDAVRAERHVRSAATKS